MPRSRRPAVLLVAAVACGSLAAPASAAQSRPLITQLVSFTGFDAQVPAGATLSVVQRCPAGTRLDAAATRTYAERFDAELQPTVRRVSRELWPAGMVTRYRVVQAADVPRDDGFGLVNAAVCAGSRAAGARSVTGRASTDLRVWGRAVAGARLFSVTLVAATDRVPQPRGASEADLPYRTAVQAAGVGRSRGALTGGVRAEQEASDDGGSGSVMTTGTVLRAVPPGRFVSMRSAYAFTVDLTRRITVTQAPEPVTIESRAGGCAVRPAQTGEGEHEVVLVAYDGPTSVVVRDPRGAVVVEQAVARQQVVEGEPGQPPVFGIAEPALVTLSEGDHTVECRRDGAVSGTSTLGVVAAEPARAPG